MLYMLDVITQKHYLVLEIQSDVRWDRVKVNLRQFDAQLCRNEAANHALRYCLEDQCHNHLESLNEFSDQPFWGNTTPDCQGFVFIVYIVQFDSLHQTLHYNVVRFNLYGVMTSRSFKDVRHSPWLSLSSMQCRSRYCSH
jgi:hypothetical protein